MVMSVGAVFVIEIVLLPDTRSHVQLFTPTSPFMVIPESNTEIHNKPPCISSATVTRYTPLDNGTFTLEFAPTVMLAFLHTSEVEADS